MLLTDLQPLVPWYKSQSINLIGLYIIAKLELIELEYSKLHHTFKNNLEDKLLLFNILPY